MLLNISKEVLSILDKNFKLKVLLIVIFFLIFSLIEIIGISSIFFFLNTVSSGNIDNITKYLNFFKLDNLNYNQVIYLLGICTIIIILFRNSFVIVQEYINNNFLISLEADLRKKLLKNYINQDSIFLGSNKSSSLFSVLYNHLSTLVHGTVNNLITIFSELIIILVLSTFLIFNSSSYSILIISLSIVSYLFFFIIFKKKIKNIGTKRVLEINKFFSLLQQTLKSIKEIKIYDYLSFVVKDIYKNNVRIKNIIIKFRIINIFPKQILEVTLIIFLVLFVIFQIDTNFNNKNLIEELIFLAVVFYRLTPRVDNFLKSLFAIQFNSKAYDLIKDHLELKNFDVKKILRLKDTIELKNIKFSYNKNKNFKLGPINLVLKKNKIYGLKGENGSGKSTLVEILSGLAQANQGSIKIDNREINYYKEKISVSYIPQKSFFFNSTILENLQLGARNPSLVTLKKQLKEVNALSIFESLNLNYDYMINEDNTNLSGGQIQRLSIIRALLKKSDVIIFDESTNAIDKKSENNILSLLKRIKSNKIILLISHSQNVLDYSDISIFMKNGKIIK